MTNEEYLNQVGKILKQEKIDTHLKLQILETVTELLEHYSVDFVSGLLTSLFKKWLFKNAKEVFLYIGI